MVILTRNGLVIALALLALPSTASAQELQTGPGRQRLLGDGDVLEVYVDEAGKLYRERRYHGIIPNVRDRHGRPPKKAPKSTKVTWVGFQQKQLFSRVFIQTNRLSRFTLHKPDPRHIVVTIDSARIPRQNERRDVITSEFRSSVERIRARRHRGNAEVVITLSRSVGYLYKQEGNYVFIDVER